MVTMYKYNCGKHGDMHVSQFCKNLTLQITVNHEIQRGFAKHDRLM